MKETHDIIIIGAGSGGLNIASFMNTAGFKVLLIDKSDKNIGGDCLNFGCVPSKALIHVSRLFKAANEAARFGSAQRGKADLRLVAAYVNEKRERIRQHENAAYFRKQGIEVMLGTASFVDKSTVQVKNKTFTAKKIVLATGSRPRKLTLPGVEKVRFHTNETIFELKHLPKRLVVIGGGPVGVELGQAFARLGSTVTIVQRGDTFLPKESPEITEVLLHRLEAEGVTLMKNAEPKAFKEKTLIVSQNGKERRLPFDEVLVSIGRVLNTEGLALERAGIEVKGGRVIVDQYLRTTNKNVFVCGDIAGSYQFTHAAELHASTIINNLFKPRPLWRAVNYDHLGWVTYTSPEIATFGLNERQLRERGIKYEKIVQDFGQEERAIVDEKTEGKLLLYVGNGYILGGSMVAEGAGELFQELLLANTAKLPISTLFRKSYPYPTATRINKQAIGQVMRRKLTPLAKRILRLLY